MPAQSQQQQKLFGLALAFKRGEVPSSEVSDEIKAIADRMSEKEIEDFASTNHKGLPKKMKEQLRNIVREIMREQAISEMNEVSINEDENPCWDGYEMVGMKMKDGKEVPNCVPKNESVNEGKFQKDDLVYNTRTKTVGIVRIGDDKYGEVKTDADGNVDVDELEKYNPIKFKHQTKAKVAPSTEKEVSKRGLFNPFKNESVNEGKASKDSTGIRKVVAIYNNVDTIIELVFDDKKDAKEVVGVMGPVLVNAINATLKHKFKPTAGNEDKLKQFKSKLKELLKLVEALIKKPSKAGIKRLETMHRNWWNHSFGGDIVFNGKYEDSIIESVNEVDTKKANILRKNMPGYVGPKFAKKASDEDLLAMADLKDEKAQLYNRYLKDVMSKISKLQKKYNIKESVNEGASTEEKRIVMMAIKKIAKYRNVPLNVAVVDTIRAAEELERTIKK